MAGEALRQVFAEFGFKVDDAPLEKMLADTERQIKLEESLSKVEKKVLADFQKAEAEKEKAKQAGLDASEKSKAEADKKAVEEQKRREKEQADETKKTSDGINLFKTRALAFAGGVAAVVVAAHRFASALAADAMALRESAIAARVTETQFQQFTFAAASAGVGADTAASGLNTLAEGLRAIEARTGGPTGALWRLGVQARNTDGTVRDTSSVMLDLADRFERVRNPVQRLRLAQQLFGASGRRMLEVLAGGSAALRRQQEDFAALGGGVLPEAVEESRRFTMAQTRMGVAVDSVRSVLATFLLPVFTRVTNAAADLTGWFSRMTRGTHIANTAFVGLGVAGVAAATSVLVAWGPVIAPIAAVALGAVALSLAFDDVQNLLEGQPSLIGDLIDRYTSFGTAARFVDRIRDAWNGVVDALGRVNEAIDRLPRWAQAGIDVATGGVRIFLPQGRSGGAETTTPLEPGTTSGGREVRAGETGRDVRMGAGGRARRPAPTAPAWTAPWLTNAPMTAPVARGGGTRMVNNTTTIAPGAIQVMGAGRGAPDIADEVMRRLREEAQRQRDEAHPQDAEE